ncbi:MAG: 23S rRNA (guanosine(2251)-2'-O)-methyltransferase RlmB [Clostridiaceae bacterium]|nr:23S rRNA (guanosine(2251)-2'-O)-methyltransferase RlmB [Clostridiaceae bacterium]
MKQSENQNLELTRIEGRNPVAEALAAGRSINRVFVMENARGDLAHLAARCRRQGAVVGHVSRSVLDRMALTRAHQGIIAEVAPYAYADLGGILRTCKEKDHSPFLLLLDHIQDANNLGAILRIADGAGIDAVVIPQRRSVPLNAAVAKASAGAVEHVPLCRVNNLSQTILMLKEAGFWIYGTAAQAATCYRKVDYAGSIAVVVGSEGQGMSQSLAGHCDFLLSIPLHGRINSLNAAVACGIIVFEAASQRDKKGLCPDP